MRSLLEICCFTAESALLAADSGADRVELCDNYTEGGTTPSIAAIRYAVENVDIPVNVIIRPRGGDFLYNDLEFSLIRDDALAAIEAGANGVVIGFLKRDGSIDVEKTRQIVELVAPHEVTFHRAFDMCENHKAAVRQLADAGVSRILTSGARDNALDGLDLLRELVQIAGDDISIMPCGSITDQNLQQIAAATDAREYHSAAMRFVSSEMNFRNAHVSMGGDDHVDEFSKVSVDQHMIRSMATILKSRL